MIDYKSLAPHCIHGERKDEQDGDIKDGFPGLGLGVDTEVKGEAKAMSFLETEALHAGTLFHSTLEVNRAMLEWSKDLSSFV